MAAAYAPWRRSAFFSNLLVLVVNVRTDPAFEVTSSPVELFDRPEYVVWQNPSPFGLYTRSSNPATSK